MKSFVLMSPKKGEIQLQELEVPEPGPQEVRVRTRFSLVSPGTERAFILGLDNAVAGYPFSPGYCTSGEVDAVGAEVTRFKIGDRVAGQVGHKAFGTVPEEQLMGIPQGVSFEHASLLPLGVIALQGVRKTRIEIGEMVLVLGLGIVGQLALQLAHVSGAMSVIGVDKVDKRLTVASRCNADAVLNASDQSWKQKVKKLTGGKGPEVIVEATGYPEAVSEAFQVAAQFGRVVLLGSTRGESTVNFYRDVHKKGLSVVGAHILSNPTQESRPGFWTWLDDARCFMSLLKNRRLQIDPLITEKAHWRDIERIYERVLSWDSEMIGTLIDWT